MPRLAGKDIPGQKKVPYSLCSIYGVGITLANQITKEAKVDLDKRARDLDSQEINKIQKILEKYLVEGDLRRQINDNLMRLKRIHCYRGLRHIAGLPCRGQRTKTNGRTNRGRRKTIGAMTKEMAAKIDAAKKEK